ncbi:cache domain-containing protein [Brachyspira hyodysenteriae]|nr:cache domain-containing protein [Brachyspira hyodysenteriae]MCZ9989035.1 cache domain-containing protein [Brachyspira hyodysenteriae]MCZ9997400.1 cache domain-containing protein [Brachyspira hyodysenteriae]MDA0005847.1 cache domain-containing protein [Brachyspira hyodysenteriae]
MQIEFNYLNELASSLEDLYNIGIRDRNTYLSVVSNYARKDKANTIAMGCLFNKDVIDNDVNYTNSEFYRDIKGQFGLYFSKNNGNVMQQKILSSELNADYFVNPKNTSKPYITPLYSYNIYGNDIKIYTWAVPIFDNDGKNIGVVIADVTPQGISKSIEKIKPYDESKGNTF